MSKFLDKTGLETFWGKIKNIFLPLTGGTISGNLKVDNLITTQSLTVNNSASIPYLTVTQWARIPSIRSREGDYKHWLDMGFNSNDVNWYEYGGKWSFWKNAQASSTSDTANLCLRIEKDYLTNKNYTYTWPNKNGTFALTSDLTTLSDKSANTREDYILDLESLPNYTQVQEEVTDYQTKVATFTLTTDKFTELSDATLNKNIKILYASSYNFIVNTVDTYTIDGTYYIMSTTSFSCGFPINTIVIAFTSTEGSVYMVNVVYAYGINKKANISDVYTKEEIDNKLGSVFRYKGNVESISDLPASGNSTGDTYNVNATGANYAWSGSAWDKLSETIDLSIYSLKSEAITSLGTSSNKYITAKKSNGTVVSTIEVPFATKSDTASSSEKLLARNVFYTSNTGILSYYSSAIATTSVSNNGWACPPAYSKQQSSIIHLNGEVDGYYSDLCFPLGSTGDIYWRQKLGSNYYGWYKVLDSNNYASVLDSKYQATGDYVTTNTIQTISANKTFDDYTTIKELFINTGDSTLKFYTGKTQDAVNDGVICMQTCIDGKDGQYHDYAPLHSGREAICLQPRGGRVYINEVPTVQETTYQLTVNGSAIIRNNLQVTGTTNGYYLDKFPYIVYVGKESFGQPTADKAWYINLKEFLYSREQLHFVVHSKGSNYEAWTTIYSGLGSLHFWGYNCTYNTYGVTNVATAWDSSAILNFYLKIDPVITEVEIYYSYKITSASIIDEADLPSDLTFTYTALPCFYSYQCLEIRADSDLIKKFNGFTEDSINIPIRTRFSLTTTGSGNAVTDLSYNSSTGKYTATKGSTFVTSANLANYLPLTGGTLTGNLTISAAKGLKVIGGYDTSSIMSDNAFFKSKYNNILLTGDSTYGISGIVFASGKGDTDINTTSGGFIQYRSYGGSASTPTTSGGDGFLLLGVVNDTNNSVYIQTPAATGLKHAVGTSTYTIMDENNTTVTTSGSGNAITSITKSGTTFTATKGATFLTSVPMATTTTLGGIKVIKNKVSTSTIKTTSVEDRYYGVQLTTDGTAFVNVPWEQGITEINHPTYTLSKDGSNIILTCSDGSISSVTDSNTTYTSLPNPNKLTIYTNGTKELEYTGDYERSLTFQAGNNVTLVGGNGNILIHAKDTTYTALKNPNAIRIQDNGTDIQSYDGSAAKVLNFKAGNNITLDSTTGDTSTITINATTNSKVTPFIITVNFFDTLGEEDSPWYDKEYMEISHSDWESLRTKLGNGEAVSIIVKQAYNGNGDWYNETAFYARVDENDDYEFTKVTFYTLYPSGYAVYKYTIDETNGSGADGSGWHNVTKQQVSSVPTIPTLLTAVGNTSVTTITSSIDYYIPSNAQRQFIRASSDFALVTHNLQNGLDYSVIVKNISADSIIIDMTAADMNGEMSYTLDSDAFIEFSFLYIGDEWIIRTLK